MITIHDGFAADFGGLGLGALTPIACKVQEEAGGRYEAELTLAHAGDGRQALLQKYRVLRVPAPVNVGAGDTATAVTAVATVTMEIWRVQVNTRLRLRQSPGGTILGSYPSGTEVVKLEEADGWMRVRLVKGGALGWMYKSYLRYARTETAEEEGDVIEPVTAREQLFRICQVKRSSRERLSTALAQHITYDLKGVIVASEYAPEGAPASEVCGQLLALADHDAGFAIHCALSEPVTADYSGRNLIDCLLNAEDGVVKQTGARLVRDNFDIYILPQRTDRARLELRRGHNLLSAEQTEDASDVVTRIRPVGQKKNGDPLYITENGGYVDSEHIDEYPVIYTKEIEYDVTVGKDGIATEAQGREKLSALAREDFDVNGFDLAKVTVGAEFVRLEQLARYAVLEKALALYMYDVVRVRDEEAMIAAELRMNAYVWDALNGRYEDTELGDVLSLMEGAGGYEIGSGGGGTRALIRPGGLADDAVTTEKIRDGAVTKDKLAWAEIEAAIREIVGEMTT